MFNDRVFDENASNELPDYTEVIVEDSKKTDDIKFEKGLIEEKFDNNDSYGINMNHIFKNDEQNFAILTPAQLDEVLNDLRKKDINCVLSYLQDFDLSHNEHLIPDKLFYKNNISWFYDYYMFYKIKKMLYIIFSGVSALNNLGFYYCKEHHAPLFIVNNVKNIKLCLVITPQIYDKIE